MVNGVPFYQPSYEESQLSVGRGVVHWVPVGRGMKPRIGPDVVDGVHPIGPAKAQLGSMSAGQ